MAPTEFLFDAKVKQQVEAALAADAAAMPLVMEYYSDNEDSDNDDDL